MTPIHLTYDNEWFFVCVEGGKSLSDTINESYLNTNCNLYIHNAYSYVGSKADLPKVSDDNGPSLKGSVDYTWEQFVENLYVGCVQKFDDWKHDITKNIFDVTPYKDCVISISWPCWVQITTRKVVLDSKPRSEKHYNISRRFTNDGWYCIGVNSEQSINNIFDGYLYSVYNDNSPYMNTSQWKIERVYKLNSNFNEKTQSQNNKNDYDLTFMESNRNSISDYWDEIGLDSINSPQNESVAMWVNIQTVYTPKTIPTLQVNSALTDYFDIMTIEYDTKNVADYIDPMDDDDDLLQMKINYKKPSDTRWLVKKIYKNSLKFNSVNTDNEFTLMNGNSIIGIPSNLGYLRETNGGETNGGETNGGETNGGETNGGETNGETPPTLKFENTNYEGLFFIINTKNNKIITLNNSGLLRYIDSTKYEEDHYNLIFKLK